MYIAICSKLMVFFWIKQFLENLFETYKWWLHSTPIFHWIWCNFYMTCYINRVNIVLINVLKLFYSHSWLMDIEQKWTRTKGPKIFIKNSEIIEAISNKFRKILVKILKIFIEMQKLSIKIKVNFYTNHPNVGYMCWWYRK